MASNTLLSSYLKANLYVSSPSMPNRRATWKCLQIKGKSIIFPMSHGLRAPRINKILFPGKQVFVQGPMLMRTVVLSPDYTSESAGELASTSHILTYTQDPGDPVKWQVQTQ